ncbi:MAG: hypothetical protein WAT19_08935 [Ferruginibacter sp.]
MKFASSLPQKCILLFLLFFCQNSFSQNLTGTWEGTTSGEYCRLVIVQKGDSCFGYTYDTGMGYCKANFEGIYNDSTRKLKGTNTSFIAKTALHGLSSYKLNYSKSGETEYLQGSAFAKRTITKILSFGLPMNTRYRKISNEVDTTELIAAKMRQPATPIATFKPDSVKQPAAVMLPTPVPDDVSTQLTQQKESRKSQLIHTIETVADSLRLTLHDNGEIDNDTVTVFLNGKIVINRLGLGVKAFETVIPIHRSDSLLSIELMANNLGSIPPNTAYLTIWAGKEKYELKASSDYTINARVDIKKLHYSREGRVEKK